MSLSVSGILEGYLTLYGWQVYSSLFLLLIAVGAVLYPVARIIFDATLAFTETGQNPALGARGFIVRLLIYILVLVLGLIPLVPLSVNAVSVQNKCGRESLLTLGQHYPFLQNRSEGSLGGVQNAHVPLLPYLAMALASGFNAVLNQATPCMADLTHLSMALNLLDFSAADDPNALRTAVDRFERECGSRARELALGFLDGKYLGGAGREYLEEQLAKYAKTPEERKKQLVYFGSPFFQEVFYKPCSGGDQTTPAGLLCTMLPLRALQPVPGFPYDASRDGDASQIQAARGEGFPTCYEWWSDGAKGLRGQLVKAGGEALKNKVTALTLSTCPGQAFLPGALCTWIGSLVNDIQDGQDVVVEQMLLAGKRQLSSKTPEVGWGTGLVTGGLFLFSDVAESVAQQAAGYWALLYIMKVGSALLQPFLLMTVFMLWGIFLVFGEMRGMMLVKGMMLIFTLSILPGLWGFADYVDDQLFMALYPNAPALSGVGIAKELMTDHSTIERVLLGFTTMVFYLVLPLLMFYLIAEAGGPTSAMRMASDAINDPARAQGRIVSGGVGGASVRGWVRPGWK